MNLSTRNLFKDKSKVLLFWQEILQRCVLWLHSTSSSMCGIFAVHLVEINIVHSLVLWLKLCRFLVNMARVSNSASASDATTRIRDNMSHFEQCSDVDPEKVAQQYKDFILDLLSIIARPLKPVLARSLARAFEGVSNQDADHRAGRIAAATQYFGYKSKSFKTGGKTSPAVAEIV